MKRSIIMGPQQAAGHKRGPLEARGHSFAQISLVFIASSCLIFAHHQHQLVDANVVLNNHQTLEQQQQQQQPAPFPSQESTEAVVAAALETGVNASAQLADIVISSIEDEQFANKAQSVKEAAQVPSADKSAANRHRYEQQPPNLQHGESIEAPVKSSSQVLTAATTADKIEPRNEPNMETTVAGGSEPASNENQIIIDHRPTGETFVSTQAPVSSTGSTQATSLSSAPLVSSNAPGDFNQQQHQHQAEQSQQHQHQQTISAQQWSQPQQIYFARSVNGPNLSQSQQTSQQQHQQQQLQPGSMMSGSNQVTSVQHPTSINSIISEQQSTGNQQQQQYVQPLAPGVTGSSAGQQLILVGNGQGSNLALMPSGSSLNGQQQLVGVIAPNGRRASISNWLRGLGSMLANIFNRRDHGGLMGVNGVQSPAQLQMSASSSGGNWIQLGPNAPHWLTQAQSALQTFQQKHQQLTLSPSGSNRFTTFIQAASGPQQSQSGFQQQQQQQSNDLQTSGSSQSYLAIQMPNGGVGSQAQAPAGSLVIGQLQPGHSQQQPQSANNLVVTTSTGAQTQSTQQIAPPISTTAVGGQLVKAADATQSSAAPIRHQVTSAAPGGGGGVAAVSSAIAPTGQQSRNFGGRSSVASLMSSRLPSGSPQQQATSNGNLPLAHYSQYSQAE